MSRPLRHLSIPDLSASEVAVLRSSPCTSYWLLEALASVERRDIHDALRDAELLVSVLRHALEARISSGGGR